MVPFLVGSVGVLALLMLARAFVGAPPSALAAGARVVGATASFIAAALLLWRGRMDLAAMLGLGGAWLMGWGPGLPGLTGRSTPSPGSVSTVRTALLEMRLAHDTGAIAGTVLAGEFEGLALDDLDEPALARIAAACASDDPDGLRLLEAYLDRRFPSRGEHAEADHDPPRPAAGRPAGPMTPEEAHEVLGLAPGAGEEAIRAAHRNLMKKLHPDQGGSTYLATRVNEAKDVLLGRHRRRSTSEPG